MKITTTQGGAIGRVKILVHGPSGVGKTRLCASTPDPAKTIILSVESGLLSLRSFDIPVLDLTEGVDMGNPAKGADGVLANLREAFALLRSGKHPYEWVCLDSISEIAEVILGGEKATAKDKRAAYGETADQVMSLVRGFRDLPLNVYMSAKQGREETEEGVLYVPLMPGRVLAQNVGYLFDEVFALRSRKGREGEPDVVRAFQTARDQSYEAKDRSGALSTMEPANLGRVAAKITAFMHATPTAAPAAQTKE